MKRHKARVELKSRKPNGPAGEHGIYIEQVGQEEVEGRSSRSASVMKHSGGRIRSQCRARRHLAATRSGAGNRKLCAYLSRGIYAVLNATEVLRDDYAIA